MIKDLEQALGYHFQNITLLQNALTHSSYANERWRDSLASNERLEFLGDSILGMVTAEHLYRTFPHRSEGELSRIRAGPGLQFQPGPGGRAGTRGTTSSGPRRRSRGGGRTRESICSRRSGVGAGVCLSGRRLFRRWGSGPPLHPHRHSGGAPPESWTIRPSSRELVQQKKDQVINTDSRQMSADHAKQFRWRFRLNGSVVGQGTAAAKSRQTRGGPEWRWADCSQHCSL
ncbi:MAG: ribonuclease III family protein [Oscillospiraceae bacterium]